MEGINKLLKDIENIKNKYPKEVDRFLTRQGNKLLRITKLRTPVVTGTLRNSWFMKKNKNEVTVYNIADYVLAVEYFAGRFMLTKSVKDIENEFESDLKKTFKEVFK